eukprot:Tbor_TRINITY_DN5506_c0_g2::TRINITY_DN5506_c0_g2_i1::g.13569::m.13569
MYMRLTKDVVTNTSKLQRTIKKCGANASFDYSVSSVNSISESSVNSCYSNHSVKSPRVVHCNSVEAVLEIYNVTSNQEVGEFTIQKKLMTIPLKRMCSIERETIEEKDALDFQTEGNGYDYKYGEILLNLLFNLEDEITDSPHGLARTTVLSTSGADKGGCETDPVFVQVPQQQIEIVVNHPKERDIWYDWISKFTPYKGLIELHTDDEPHPFPFQCKRPDHCVPEYVSNFLQGAKKKKDVGKDPEFLRAPGEGQVMITIDKVSHTRRLQCLKLGEILISNVDGHSVNRIEVSISDSRIFVSDPFSCEFFIELSHTAASSCTLQQKNIKPPLIKFDKPQLIAFKASSPYDRDIIVEWLVKVKGCPQARSITYPYEQSDEDSFTFLPFDCSDAPMKVRVEILTENNVEDEDEKKKDRIDEKIRKEMSGSESICSIDTLNNSYIPDESEIISLVDETEDDLSDLSRPSLVISNSMDINISSTHIEDLSDKSDVFSKSTEPSLVVEEAMCFDQSILPSSITHISEEHLVNDHGIQKILQSLHPNVRAVLSHTMSPTVLTSAISHPLRSEAKVLYATIGASPPSEDDDYFIDMIVSLDFCTGHLYGLDLRDSTVVINIPVTSITCVTSLSHVFGTLGFTLHCLCDDMEVCVLPEDLSEIPQWLYLLSCLSVNYVKDRYREEINKDHQIKVSHEGGRLCAYQEPGEANSSATVYECVFCNKKSYVCDVTGTFHPEALLRLSTIKHFQAQIESDKLTAELEADFAFLETADDTSVVNTVAKSNLTTLGSWIIASLPTLPCKAPDSMYEIESIISQSYAFIEKTGESIGKLNSVSAI